MRRSVREALVGFSLLAGLAGGLGFWAWLRGVSLARDTWATEARFEIRLEVGRAGPAEETFG